MKFSVMGVSVVIGTDTFGLKEAESAARYAQDAAQARAVLGVVVGVLGYENTVAADVAQVVSLENELIEANKDQITAMKRQIATLEVSIADSNAHVASVRQVADLFTVASSGK